MTVQEIFRAFIKNTGFSEKVLFDEEIAPKTTFKIGGKAAVFIAPENYFQLQDILTLVKKYSIPKFILGGGSNVVFRDDVFDGVVISTSNFTEINVMDCYDFDTPEDSEKKYKLVSCGSGLKMDDLVKFCMENDLWGLENFYALPGTVGGALYMNARCFEKSICENFVQGFYFDPNSFEGIELPYNESEWSYKKSPFQSGNKIILQGIFKLEQKPASEHEKLVQLNEKYLNERKSRGHFDFPSAGSVFKNNHEFGEPSGRIIDECGLRGTKIGQAQVAPFHGNFIINLGGATQKDVKKLVEFVVNTVEERKGFKLEPEIIFF